MTRHYYVFCLVSVLYIFGMCLFHIYLNFFSPNFCSPLAVIGAATSLTVTESPLWSDTSQLIILNSFAVSQVSFVVYFRSILEKIFSFASCGTFPGETFCFWVGYSPSIYQVERRFYSSHFAHNSSIVVWNLVSNGTMSSKHCI
jgi:hypothetical protein